MKALIARFKLSSKTAAMACHAIPVVLNATMDLVGNSNAPKPQPNQTNQPQTQKTLQILTYRSLGCLFDVRGRGDSWVRLYNL